MSDGSSRIIELGICVDNRDPLGLGRIRVQSFSGGAGASAQAFDYKPWDEKDPFIALPFLPNNINYIPKQGQSVKLINYDPVKDVVNREYISGPFTTTHDFNTQKFSSQTKHTSYGGSDIESPKIVNLEDGTIIDEFVKGSIANYDDYAVYGKYGSDVLLTENGLVLRGGKFLPKSMVVNLTNDNTKNKPVMSDSVSSLYMKKFDENREYVETIVNETQVESKPLKSIIEYNINSFSGGNVTVDFYVYLIKSSIEQDVKVYGRLYYTNTSNLSSTPIISGATQLITTGTTEPTFSVTVDNVPSDDMSKVYIKIRKTLKKLHQNGTLKQIDNLLPFAKEDLHPFYFRPTSGTTNSELPDQQNINRLSIFNNIILATDVGPKNGLVYSKEKISPQTNLVPKKITTLKVTPTTESTFATLKSDKVYLISPKSEQPTNDIRIDFKKLDRYELSHENYMTDIHPFTYSMVRGEKLIEILKSITDLIFSHQHNLIGPAVPSDPNYVKLLNLLATLEKDILNKEIRIN
jgi:hypothetical protein